MASIHARTALLASGWATDVRVETEHGRISWIATGVAPQPGDDCQHALIPGCPNLHSHAFQRGMAGLSEARGPSTDSFWTWRDVMYRFALSLSPDQAQAIAAQAYVEMLEAGFTRVGEFHYLHHDRDGRPYGGIAEMASQICAAASATGLGLTLLPVFYAHANFGGTPPHDGQRRFITRLDRFEHLLTETRRHASQLETAVVGIAPHSLRAVTEAELAELQKLVPDGPIHIHAAEQLREVDDCLAWSAQRPIEWLLNHAGIDQRWCIVHATHMTSNETAALARSGAVAGLCPVTEANLGDGIFSAADFCTANGRFGIGTDSNILIDAAGELRQLEYSQRLQHRARNVLAGSGASTGRALYDQALAGGARALGIVTPALAPGASADMVSLDPDADAFAGLDGDRLLDAWIFASHRMIDGVWVGGIKRVTAGRHHDGKPIGARFKTVLREVLG